MKNFASIHLKTENGIKLNYRGYADGLDCAIVDIIDGNDSWDCATFFIPASETKAIRAAIDAFNSAYQREKELDLLEAAE